jgi:hypothetical protein
MDSGFRITARCANPANVKFDSVTIEGPCGQVTLQQGVIIA